MDNFTGIERIKELAKKATIPGIKKVAEYLINREDMNEKYQNENKDLDKMWNYITERAREKQVNGTACIEDSEVYNWAIHYWDESEEDLAKEKTKDEKLPKKETKKSKKASSEELDTQKEDITGQNDDDIVFKWHGKNVTRAQFNSKEYLSW